MNKKVIAISATHGCGKTTLVYSLAARLKKQGKNVVVLNELARECPFAINQEGEDRTQIWLLAKQITRELELMDRYDYVIVDRSMFDAFAYAGFLTDGSWQFDKLYFYIVAHIKKYYKATYLLNPDTFNFNVEDGVRDTDNHFRNTIHENLLMLFNTSKLDYKLAKNEEDIYRDFPN